MTQRAMCMFLLAAAGGLASAQTCVTPIIPGGNDPRTGQPWQGPGPCPNSVTAANFQVSIRPGTILGANDDNGDQALKVFPIVSGPSPLTWTSGWTNEGDIDANISPVDFNNPLSYPPNQFIRLRDGRDPATGANDGGGLRTYAWAINQYRGTVMMVPRINGRDNLDFLFSGGPAVGRLYGLTNVSADTFRTGRAYSMINGTHSSGGGSMYLSMHFAGSVGNQEMSFDCGAAWFPFNQWTGGFINRQAGESAAFLSDGSEVAASPGLSPSVVAWNLSGPTGPAMRISLPGVNPETDGILLAQPYQDSNDAAFVSVAATPANWELTYRLTRTDSNAEIVTPSSGNVRVHFVYVPFCASNLTAARINGSTGTVIGSASRGAFTLTRLGTGEYRLSIPGESDATGTLILQSNGLDPQSDAAGSRVFFSYEPEGNDFIIQGRRLVTGGNTFGEDSLLTDSDFSFVWVDHSTPPAPCCSADFNNDSSVDFFDYLDFVAAFAAEAPSADFNGDGTVDFFDYLDFVAAFESGC